MVVFGLLPHEQKMSVVHFLIKRVHDNDGNDDDIEPIKSKERLTFHVGYRRFTACPIYSQHSNANKHKVIFAAHCVCFVILCCICSTAAMETDVLLLQVVGCGTTFQLI